MSYARSDMPVVEVVWIDSNHMRGWQNLHTLETDTGNDLECSSVGYLFRDNAECVTLIQSTSETGMFDAIQTIPKRCIVTMQTIATPKP